MWRPRWIATVWPPKTASNTPLGIRRDRAAVLFAIATTLCMGSAYLLSSGTQVLMPGPLASAHGAIKNCNACHTKSGTGKLSWVHGLAAGDPVADNKACLACHKMPNTAFNAHGAATSVLDQSARRLREIAERTSQPRSARLQNLAFPTDRMVAHDLSCATCHQEHQGVDFKLSRISNEQCRSCHVVRFDSFDGHHPEFDGYPFKRRTPIVYDHESHFGKHFPDVAKKDPTRRIPATCATCHNSREDRRVMSVAPFDQTCANCHLNQIVGNERASGPKGIAFLTLPGLDLQTLKAKNATIGEWPEASEAALSPFMKVMISRTEAGRALVKTVEGLNLEDLSSASDAEIRSVTRLVWEIKRLYFALISKKASDVLADLDIVAGAKPSASLIADLTASIPRDVITSAQQQWLPNLAAEMASRKVTTAQQHGDWNTVTTESKAEGAASRVPPSGSDGRRAATESRSETEARKEATAGPTDTGGARTEAGNGPRSASELPPPPMRAGLGDPQRLAQADGANDALPEDGESGGVIKKRWSLPSGTSRAIENRNRAETPSAEPEKADGKRDAEKPRPDKNADKAPAPEGGAGKAAAEKAAPESGKATVQTDDLLFPTEEELRAVKAGSNEKTAPQPDQPEGKPQSANAPADGATPEGATPTAPAKDDTAATGPQTKAVPVASIESDVDPESWAEYGGWYRQDYAIFYRPTGHKDKFVYAWLFLTGPQAPKGDKGPPAAVFDYLTAKDAQGSCTKCHSIDDIQGKGRAVNFSPPSPKSKTGRFTSFIHEPHFGIMEDRGCLTCHELGKGRPYLKSYEQGNPREFTSNFAEVKKSLCRTCHASGMARQDCLLCHRYHVNGVVTPMMSTKLPTQ